MAVVKRGQLRLVEPLDDRQDPSVHEPYIGVGVPVTDFAYAPVVLGLQLLYSEGAGNYVVENGEEDSGVKPSVHQPVYFNQDRRWDYEHLVGMLKKI